jgi:hypothetical protein
MRELVTLSMRELERVKIIEAVAARGLLYFSAANSREILRRNSVFILVPKEPGGLSVLQISRKTDADLYHVQFQSCRVANHVANFLESSAANASYI